MDNRQKMELIEIREIAKEMYCLADKILIAANDIQTKLDVVERRMVRTVGMRRCEINVWEM